MVTLRKHLHHHELGNTKRHISEDSVLKTCGDPEEIVTVLLNDNDQRYAIKSKLANCVVILGK